MKATAIFFVTCLLLILASCEGRSGYLDRDQESTVSLLTSAEWVLTWSKLSSFPGETYDDETNIYRFERNGDGWIAIGSVKDPDTKENIGYFQWAFTNENFAVICMIGSVDRYWLIEKLTPTELWVTAALQDPVLHPSQDNDKLKFKSRRLPD